MSSNPFLRVPLNRSLAFLREYDPGVQELSQEQLDADYPDSSYVAGWRVRLNPGTDDRLIDVLITWLFPFSPPKIGIAALKPEERPKFGTITGDKMCIKLEGAPWPITADEAAVSVALERTRAVMTEWKERPDDKIRLIEIASYWPNKTQPPPLLYSLVQNKAGTRVIFAATDDKERTYVADTQEALDEFLARIAKKEKAVPGLGVLVDAAEIPPFFENNAELYQWIQDAGGDALRGIVDNLSIKTGSVFPLLVRLTSDNGTILLAAWPEDPRDSADLERIAAMIEAGSIEEARQGLVAAFFSSKGKTKRGSVQRIDTEWLFTRGAGVDLPKALEKHVVLIGCGALGSSIATRLAKAGIGKLTLIDPDTLSWDNILRHHLGAWYVGFDKVFGLFLELGYALPHVEVKTFAKHWETVWSSNPAIFTEADLIVSTVADWPSEAMLNAVARTTPDFPPVVYTWLEDRAAAAQTLYVAANGGCLACGMTPTGEFSERVVRFREPTMKRVPGCDGFFEPYSASDADAAASVAVERIIQILSGEHSRSTLTTWIGGKRLLMEYEGEIRPEWSQRHGDSGDGRRLIELPWPINPACPFCAKQ